MFFSSRTLGKAVLCVGKELSSVINSAGKSKSKLFKMTMCGELSHEGPRLLPLIYPDLMSFYLTRGKMAFYGDGIQRKTLRLAAGKLTFERGSPPTGETPVRYVSPTRAHNRTHEELFK